MVATVYETREGEEVIGSQEWVTRTGWTGYLTVGAEAVLWSRLGVGLEAGGAEAWGEPGFRLSRLIGGIGVHYYW